MQSILISIIVSFSIAGLIIRYQHLHSHISADHDLTGVQKFHAIAVPRVGGIAVVAGSLCGGAFYIGNGQSFIFPILICSLPVFIAGLVEDLTKKVSARIRLLAAILAAALGGNVLNVWINHISMPFIDYMLTFYAFSVLLTCIAVAGVSNAFNIIDGYNGLSGGVFLICILGLGFVAKQLGDETIFSTCCIFGGAALGFLIWNYPLGKIFLGDGGAYLIGFLLAELSILLVNRNSEVSAWFPFLLVSYPIFEVLFTIIRRILLSKEVGKPDADHLHQLIHRRVIKSAVGNQSIKEKIIRNALTTPFLWGINLVSVVPACVYWAETNVLKVITISFAAAYTLLYTLIYYKITK